MIHAPKPWAWKLWSLCLMSAFMKVCHGLAEALWNGFRTNLVPWLPMHMRPVSTKASLSSLCSSSRPSGKWCVLAFAKKPPKLMWMPSWNVPLFLSISSSSSTTGRMGWMMTKSLASAFLGRTTWRTKARSGTASLRTMWRTSPQLRHRSSKGTGVAVPHLQEASGAAAAWLGSSSKGAWSSWKQSSWAKLLGKSHFLGRSAGCHQTWTGGVCWKEDLEGCQSLEHWAESQQICHWPWSWRWCCPKQRVLGTGSGGGHGRRMPWRLPIWRHGVSWRCSCSVLSPAHCTSWRNQLDIVFVHMMRSFMPSAYLTIYTNEGKKVCLIPFVSFSSCPLPLHTKASSCHVCASCAYAVPFPILKPSHSLLVTHVGAFDHIVIWCILQPFLISESKTC